MVPEMILNRMYILRTIRAYWSKRRVVPQFFLELITTQLRFYMVSPQLSLLRMYISGYVGKTVWQVYIYSLLN